MSVQRRSFFALKCSQEYWGEVPPVPDFSLCGGSDFTLGATFLYSHECNDSVLLRQEGMFTLGVKNGAVYFNAENLGNFHTDSSGEPKLKEDEWNRIDIVFDGENLKIYVQGLLSEEFKATGKYYADNVTRLQFGKMDGYMQELTLYSRALSEEEVLHLPFTHAVRLENTELYLDFGSFLPSDQGRHAFPIQLKGRCDTVNLVYSFAPGRGGFALPYGAGQINPGGKDLSEFTILAAVFPAELMEADQGKRVIFSNGEANKAQSIALGVDAATHKPYLEVGKNRFDYTAKLENYVWYQISASVKGTEVMLYVDGVNSGSGTLSAVFERTDPPALMLGNQMSEGQTDCGFCGYIDQVSVFSCALSNDRLSAYADTAPYRFESNLAAIWLMAEPYPAELVSGGALTYSAEAGCTLFENTVLDREPMQLKFNMPNIPTGEDEVTSWEARIAAETFIKGIESLTGMSADGGFVDSEKNILNGSVEKFVTETMVDSGRLNKLYTEGEFSSKDMQELFRAFGLGACLGALSYAFYCTAQNDGFRHALVLRRFIHYLKLAITVSNWPVIGGAMTSSAVAAVKYYESKPAPDAGEADVEEADVTLQSIAFYHEDSRHAGALFALPDFGEEPQLPEWQRVEKGITSAPVLYHRDIPNGKTPSLNLKFYCKLKKSTPAKLTFSANCIEGQGLSNVLGNPESVNIEISKSGAYSINVPLSNHHLRTAALKAHCIRWNWSIWTSSTGTKLIGSTSHTVHVLAATPLSPWTVELNSDFPPVYSAISLCHRIAELASSEKDEECRFAEQFVSWAHNGGIKSTEWKEDSRYASWGMEDNCMLGFDTRSCIKALNDGTGYMGNLDCACLHYTLTRLEGLSTLRLFQLTPLDSPNSLMLRKHRRAGADKDDSHAIVNAYHVCGIPGENEESPPRIWDGFLKFYDNEGNSVLSYGIRFCEQNPAQDMITIPYKDRYRSLLCSDGDTCQIALAVELILPEKLPPRQIIPGNPVLATNGIRVGFDSAVLNSIVLELPNTSHCHVVSYHSIENVIIGLINDVQLGKITQEDLKRGLTALYFAVTTNNTENDPYRFNATAANTINGLIIKKDFSNNIFVATQAQKLLYAFSNTLDNLRVGYTRWNSGLSDSYDPGEWVYIHVKNKHNPTEKEAYLLSSYEDPCIQRKLPCNMYRNAPVNESGFYLHDTQKDAYRLTILSDSRNPKHLICTRYIQEGKINLGSTVLCMSDPRIPVMYSSLNQWDYDLVDKYTRHYVRNIFYLDDENNKWCRLDLFDT